MKLKYLRCSTRNYYLGTYGWDFLNISRIGIKIYGIEENDEERKVRSSQNSLPIRN